MAIGPTGKLYPPDHHQVLNDENMLFALSLMIFLCSLPKYSLPGADVKRVAGTGTPISPNDSVPSSDRTPGEIGVPVTAQLE